MKRGFLGTKPLMFFPPGVGFSSYRTAVRNEVA